ncbi:MAG: hypothetical protein M3203_14665 [Actinomycetota bacterium]|nr:hypothetical protein [Actinomycetota bacterium]
MAASGLPFAELEGELDRLVERFRAVIDEDLVQGGGAPAGAVERHVRTGAA